jgi:hypothetical protein
VETTGLLRATARAGCGVRVRGMIMTAWSHQQVTEQGFGEAGVRASEVAAAVRRTQGDGPRAVISAQVTAGVAFLFSFYFLIYILNPNQTQV